MSRRPTHELRNAIAGILGHLDAMDHHDPLEVNRRCVRIRAKLWAALEALERIEAVDMRSEPLDTDPEVERSPVPSTGRPPADGEAMGSEVIDGTYRLVSLIGRGGMGTVSLAWDERLQRDVALKHLDHEMWGTADARAAFAREARAMARVHHPNVVTIYALGEHRDKPYIAMEFVPGITLRSYMQRGPLTLDEALGVVDQLCSGVTAIHRTGAVHRDLKPSNILVGPAFRVVITDFGLAHQLHRDDPVLRGGTPGYMAPESTLSGEAPGVAGDVYSLGVITYELLTGCRVFEGQSAGGVVAAQLEDDVPRVSNQRPDVPAEFDSILARAVAVDPDQRFGTVDELRAALFATRNRLAEHYPATVHVVDDDDDVRHALVRLVKRALPGAEVLPFADGRSSLDFARRRAPDIALVDLAMPDMNGIELTAGLRALPEPVENIVVVTGQGGASDWEVLSRIGASGFLLKPVDATALSALLHRLAPKAKLASGAFDRGRDDATHGAWPIRDDGEGSLGSTQRE